MAQLTERQLQLLIEPNLAHVATLSVATLTKDDPRIALSVVDHNHFGNYVEIRGSVVEITRKGADAHYNSLARKYIGPDYTPDTAPGEQRIIVKIEPAFVGGMFLQ